MPFIHIFPLVCLSDCLSVCMYVHTVKPVYTTTTHETTQKWSPWAGGQLIKHLYETATNQMWSFLAGF